MKKLFTFRNLCFTAVIASALTSCDREELPTLGVVEGEKPLVDFTIDTTGRDPNNPFLVKFVNNSKRFKELEWVFGDDSVNFLSAPNIAHQYTRNGAFKVIVTAIGEDGTKAVMARDIRIDPAISIKVEPEGDAIKFTNTSGLQGKSVEWDFNDGSGVTKPTESSVIYKYKNPNALNSVKLSIKLENGSVGSYTYLIRNAVAYKDVTEQYLKNFIRPFKSTVRNRTSGEIGRWGLLDNWTANGAVRNHEDGVGGFDRDWEGGNNLSFEAWGGQPKIINGKLYQSPVLPAAKYIYACLQPNQEMRGRQNEDYALLVAAQGDGLPDRDKKETALAFTKLLHPNDVPGKWIVLAFENPQAGQVSMGIVATLNVNEQFIRAQEFKLYKSE